MSKVAFELRNLKSEDMFTMFRILNKIGFSDFKEKLSPEKTKQITKVYEEYKAKKNKKGEDAADKDGLLTYVGVHIFTDVTEILLSNIPKCEQEMYTFLSGLSGMTVEEVANLPMPVFAEMVIAVIKKEDFKDFFKVVSGLFK